MSSIIDTVYSVFSCLCFYIATSCSVFYLEFFVGGIKSRSKGQILISKNKLVDLSLFTLFSLLIYYDVIMLLFIVSSIAPSGWRNINRLVFILQVTLVSKSSSKHFLSLYL